MNEYFIEHGLLGCNGYTTLKASPLNNRRSFRPAVPMLYQWHSEGVLHLPAHLTLFGRPFQGRAVSSGAVSRGCSAPTVIERQPLRGLARLLGSGCLGVGILRFNLSRLRAVSFTERESPDGTTDCIVMLWLDNATHPGLSMLDDATHPGLRFHSPLRYRNGHWQFLLPSPRGDGLPHRFDCQFDYQCIAAAPSPLGEGCRKAAGCVAPAVKITKR